jgi:hypothetical protein
MPAFSADLSRWFHDHHGIAALSDLVRVGVTPSQRQSLIRSGTIVEVFRGVYRLTAAPLTFEGRCAAVCAADPSCVISCFSAGRLWGLRKCQSEWIHVSTSRRTKPITSGVVTHRTTTLSPADVVRRPDGIRLTTAARTMVDLAQHASDLRLRSILEQVIDLQLCTVQELQDVANRLCRPGRAGSARARAIIVDRGDGAASDSHDEVALLLALQAAGLTRMTAQPPVRLLDGIVVHPDIGDSAMGFYIEVDHPVWHDSGRLDYDTSRDRRIRLTGAEVHRVASAQVELALGALVAELVALYRRRCAQIGVRASP